MRERELFEQSFPVPVGIYWNEISEQYDALPGAAGFDDVEIYHGRWEAWQAARAQDAQAEQLKDWRQEGPSLSIRIGEAVHLAFRGSPGAVSVRKRLMHPFTVYADHDVENYARDVIIGVLEALLQELPPARIRSLEQRLSEELSEAVECYAHSGNHPAPPHPQPEAAPQTHSDQAGQLYGHPDTSLCTQSQDSPQE